MDGHPVKGWYRDPAGPDEFRYWDGNEWTAHATVPNREGGMPIAPSGRQGAGDNLWYRSVLNHPLVCEVLAWMDSSLPLARGRLRRSAQPPAPDSVDPVLALRNRR
jgi:hypothetical protein